MIMRLLKRFKLELYDRIISWCIDYREELNVNTESVCKELICWLRSNFVFMHIHQKPILHLIWTYP